MYIVRPPTIIFIRLYQNGPQSPILSAAVFKYSTPPPSHVALIFDRVTYSSPSIITSQENHGHVNNEEKRPSSLLDNFRRRTEKNVDLIRSRVIQLLFVYRKTTTTVSVNRSKNAVVEIPKTSFSRSIRSQRPTRERVEYRGDENSFGRAIDRLELRENRPSVLYDVNYLSTRGGGTLSFFYHSAAVRLR